MKKFLPLLLCLFLLSSSLNEVQAQTQVTIAETRATDGDGAPLLAGELVEVTGIAIGPNYRPAGLTFVLFDVNDNVGVTIFSNDDPMGYPVTDGDELTITGTIDQFSGLIEVIPTSITVNSQGNPIPDAEEVSTLDENSEAKLVEFKNATFVDAGQWQSSGSFNIDVTNGTETIQLRIDSDTDNSGAAIPEGYFNVTGIGGQYDQDVPYTEGYQLLPRAKTDFETILSTNNPNFAGKIEIYPNPASDFIQIDTDGIINEIMLFDLSGKLIKQISSSNTIEVTDVPFGSYIMKIELNTGNFQQKVNISRR